MKEFIIGFFVGITFFILTLNTGIDRCEKKYNKDCVIASVPVEIVKLKESEL